MKLTDKEYERLEKELGPEELQRCIAYVDESAQATGNRNRWKDFTVVLLRCSEDNWGGKRTLSPKEIPKGASGVLGEAEQANIQRVLQEEV